MIYTLTLSPAVDLYINANNKKHYILAGGKGINVSKVLKHLKTESICLGFVGGKTGKYIQNDLNKNKIKSDFVITKQPTRINMKITCDKEIEINQKPVSITKHEYKQLKDKLLKLNNGDILVVSGSLSKNLDINYSKSLLDKLAKKGVNFVFDTSSKLLKKLCKYKPLFVKPNVDELSFLFNKKITNKKQIIFYANKLLNYGAKNVLVSLGKKGAILVNKKLVIYHKAPNGKVVSTIGAGDSMVAGFLYQYLKTNDYKQSLKFAIAAGSATAFSKNLAYLNNIIILSNKI